MSYVRRGHGAPLLLVMGMAGHLALWTEPFLTELERDFEIVAYDNRGIGGSTDVPGQWTVADLAEDAVAILDEVGWDTAHVMGISMGGMNARSSYCGIPNASAGSSWAVRTAAAGDPRCWRPGRCG